jgi:hypothetical protein
MPKIPFLSIADKAIVARTQDLVPIADITEDIVLYKDGGAALIMESTSLNFSLLSQREQEAVIAAYAGLVNSFSFTVQIVVRSQKKDISGYMKQLDQAQQKIADEKLSKIMQGYKAFILDAVKKKNVLSKKFYIAIPFTPLELGVGKSIKSGITSASGQNKPLTFPKSYVLRKAKITLLPKRDHLMRQMGRLGIQLKHLRNDDLVKLFFNIYNPETPNREQNIFE